MVVIFFTQGVSVKTYPDPYLQCNGLGGFHQGENLSPHY